MVRLEVRDVSLGYGGRVVMENISFSLSTGDMVGLIGPNGCGKSTIIRALSRVISPCSGRILLDGTDIAGIPRQELARRLGVVAQMPLLPSAFTAFEIVLMGRNPHLGLFQYEGPRDISIAREAMERTGTSALAGRRVSELSGGEIQSLLIARVLAQETRVILLDEPTANLDIGRQVDILDMMRKLCAESGVAVLAAIHDLNLAAQYCHRLVLLGNGGIHAEGTPGQVITPQNIREVYGVDGCVYPHPVNGLPTVLLRPGNGATPSPRGPTN